MNSLWSDILSIFLWLNEELYCLCRLGRILKEKIVLCDDLEQKKLAKSASASGIIFQNEKSQPFAHDYDEVPSVGINSKQAKKIHDEIRYAKLISELRMDHNLGHTDILFFFFNYKFFTAKLKK